jgi:hypothetical protein
VSPVRNVYQARPMGDCWAVFDRDTPCFVGLTEDRAFELADTLHRNIHETAHRQQSLRYALTRPYRAKPPWVPLPRPPRGPVTGGADETDES